VQSCGLFVISPEDLCAFEGSRGTVRLYTLDQTSVTKRNDTFWHPFIRLTKASGVFTRLGALWQGPRSHVFWLSSAIPSWD
jgi:hypothetical protein